MGHDTAPASLVTTRAVEAPLSLLGVRVCYTDPTEAAELRRLTSDGRSHTEFGGGCSPVGDRVVFYRRATAEAPEGQNDDGRHMSLADHLRRTTYRDGGGWMTVSEARKLVAATLCELWVLELASGEAVRVVGLGYPFNATWSRDGAKLAFGLAPSAYQKSEAVFQVWDAARDETIHTSLRGTLDAFSQPYSRPWWSPDGSRFAVEMRRADGSSGVFIVPIDGADAVEVAAQSAGNSFQQLALAPNVWSTDGARLVFVRKAADGLGQVCSVDARGEDMRPVSEALPGIVSALRAGMGGAWPSVDRGRIP